MSPVALAKFRSIPRCIPNFIPNLITNPQPLYCTSMPYIVNVTLLSGLGVTSHIVDEPQWVPDVGGPGDVVQVCRCLLALPQVWIQQFPYKHE